MFYRLTHSYVLAVLIGCIASALFAVFLPVSSFLVPILCACATILFAISNWKKLRYEFTLTRNIFLASRKSARRVWWNQITPQIILGALPLKNKGHHKKLFETANVRAVLSVVEPFEINNLGLFSEPVAPTDWKNKSIDHLLIDTPDFHPISLRQIEQGVEFIRSAIQQRKVVYVHCKAGRGRSTTMVICYLLKYGEAKNLEEAFKFIQQFRSHILLTEAQREAVSEYHQKYCKRE